MDEKHYDIIEDGNKNHQDQYHNDMLAQVVFTGLTLALVFSVFGVILLANFGSDGEQKAYACIPPTATPTDIYSWGAHIQDNIRAAWAVYYPNLWWYATRITGLRSDAYNCFGYALNPANPINIFPYMVDYNSDGIVDDDELDFYITMSGYTECTANDPDLKITIYGKVNLNSPTYLEATHAERAYNSDLGESKLGASVRITHPKWQLDGPRYGTPIRYYE